MKSKVINPYSIGKEILLGRIKWDLLLESWRSRIKLKKLRDRHRGKKAVILCNGPSLNDTNFASLDDVFTFGLNKINLLFKRTEFRPSAIVSVNKLVLQQNKEFFNSTDIPLFMGFRGYRYINNREMVTFIHTTNYRDFAKNCSVSLFEGFTVTYVALQLAYHMGFEKVALVGCDHNFVTKGPANKAVKSGEEDPNHFDKSYFSKGQKWQLPDLFESEISYYMAKGVFESNGREIYNCTEGGKLEIFNRLPLNKFLSL